MIAFIKGNIVNKEPGYIVIDTGGIGYGVRISNHTFDRLPATGQAITLHIHHHISDNDQQLFGFASTEERNLFELLITVKSIGPRLALGLLSAMPPRRIVDAIISQNSGLISQSPGIGKKSAERIVLELNDKLGDLVSSDDSDITGGSLHDETISALEALGYPRMHAHKAVQSAASKGTAADNVSDLLKQALQYLQS